MAVEALCSVTGCDKRVFARGHCRNHYYRLMKHGSPEAGRASPGGAARCSVDGCDARGPYRKGLCNAHHRRLLRHGNPLAGQKPRPAAGEPLRYLLAHMRDGCGYPWPFETIGAGYPRLKVDGERVQANRYVCELFHGPAPTPEHEAAHSCNNPGCFFEGCLRWATTVENNADKVEHGTHNRGERHNLARLTEEDVRAIRSSAESPQTLAIRYETSLRHIYNIRARKAWHWLD